MLDVDDNEDDDSIEDVVEDESEDVEFEDEEDAMPGEELRARSVTAATAPTITKPKMTAATGERAE